MNNYHLFLIRSDSITQIAAHLVAGIIALVLIAQVSTSADAPMPEIPAAQVTAVVLPAGTPMLAASE
jgi:hypothetical protein